MVDCWVYGDKTRDDTVNKIYQRVWLKPHGLFNRLTGRRGSTLQLLQEERCQVRLFEANLFRGHLGGQGHDGRLPSRQVRQVPFCALTRERQHGISDDG
jgi:hypothetical protein